MTRSLYIYAKTHKRRLCDKKITDATLKAAKPKEINRAKYNPSTFKTKLSNYERILKPHIGKLDIKDITPLIVINCLKKLANRKAMVTMKKAKTIIHYVFRLAISRALINFDPTTVVNNSIPQYKEKNYPAITTPDKLKKLLIGLEDYPGHYLAQLALQFLILTFVRPGMIRSMEWVDVNVLLQMEMEIS